MRLFDVYLAVDWSARSQPSPAAPVRDALWVGEAVASNRADETSETYWRTRHACLEHLHARLLYHIQAGRRVFIGCDFPYGYPAGFARALGLHGKAPPWRYIWDELTLLIVDNPDNRNNRFAVAAALNTRCGGSIPGPFWGCPIGHCAPQLLPTSPRYPYPTSAGPALARFRHVERSARGVQPVWRLYGTASVGSQALVGIPALHRLRNAPALAAVSRIWPFETGFTTTPTPEQGPAIIHAEIWPGLVPDALDASISIRDQAQVRAAVRWLAHLDNAGQLGVLFGPPAALPPEVLAVCVAEEGWIVGAI